MNSAQFLKCLADETRLHCCLLIASEGELCVCELMAALQQSQPKISRHLNPLRQAGLLVDRRQGQWVYYSLSPDAPPWLRGLLQSLAEFDKASLAIFKKNLCAMPDRPRCC